jgi:hypothetical protein
MIAIILTKKLRQNAKSVIQKILTMPLELLATLNEFPLLEAGEE